MHVIAGDCPTRAGMQGREPDLPPAVFRRDVVDGRLVGFVAVDAGGEITHHGTSLHLHAVLGGEDQDTGHVDAAGLGAGAVLRVPRR